MYIGNEGRSERWGEGHLAWRDVDGEFHDLRGREHEILKVSSVDLTCALLLPDSSDIVHSFIRHHDSNLFNELVFYPSPSLHQMSSTTFVCFKQHLVSGRF